MLEKILRPGAIIHWNKPRDANFAPGGRVVASAGQPGLMLHGGEHPVGDILRTRIASDDFGSIGYVERDVISYDWLDYAPGQSAFLSMGANDVLTGYMSGCIILHGISNTGQLIIYHVGTVDGADDLNKDVKKNMRANMPRDTVGYSPFHVWNPAELQTAVLSFGVALGPKRVAAQTVPLVQAYVFGLVTAAGDMLSILMARYQENGSWTNNLGLNSWCVCGIRRATDIMGNIRLFRFMGGVAT